VRKPCPYIYFCGGQRVYLDRMRGTEDIGMVVAQAFEVVDAEETRSGHAKPGSARGDGKEH
jgi:hypothetical protein